MLRNVHAARVAGMLLGFAADRTFADPRRHHPVAGFGWAAVQLERVTYRDSRAVGAVHTAGLVAASALLGVVLDRCVRDANYSASAGVTAAVTWVALGGTTLARTGEAMGDLLVSGDDDGARLLLPSLCGRDPASLDADGLVRASVESVAENTSDAQVAPLFWAAIGGAPGVLAYRAINTLDAMIGHRSPRYREFGWAAARLDDIANYLPARLTALLTLLCAPVIGGSPATALAAWRRDARRHPSPNAGVVEAAFAGALGVRLGGPTYYHHELQIRPTLGDGRTPRVADLQRAVRLSRSVQLSALAVLCLSVAARSGR